MPSTSDKKKFFDGRSSLDPDGAGGSPLGETPAPPRSRRGRGVDRAVVDDAVDRARLRASVGDALPDEVIDELLSSNCCEKSTQTPSAQTSALRNAASM
jgi:hypothetical protein